MPKAYPFIHPDLEPGRGATRVRIDELIAARRAGTIEGGEAIAAIAELLMDEERQPFLGFLPLPDGPVAKLAAAFHRFLAAGAKADDLFVAGLGSATGSLTAILQECGAAGGEVITASLNYPGVVNAIVRAGATPRFVDIAAETWSLDPEAAEAAVGEHTRAVLLTHLNRALDLEPFRSICEAHQIPLVQDASLAIGSTHAGARPGRVNVGPGGATVLSLATSKPITGLGGAIVTARDAARLERLVSIAYQGQDFHAPTHLAAVGMHNGMNEINAVIAVTRLARAEELFARRRVLREAYEAALTPLVTAGRLELQPLDDETVPGHFAVAFDERDRIAEELYRSYRIVIATWPLGHEESVYRDRLESVPALPVTERLRGRIAFLPFHTHLDEGEVETIVLCLERALSTR